MEEKRDIKEKKIEKGMKKRGENKEILIEKKG